MTEEEPEQQRTPPTRIGHEFQRPIVEELPRDTPHPRERVHQCGEGDIPDTQNGLDG
jgi:hypothetical protein